MSCPYYDHCATRQRISASGVVEPYQCEAETLAEVVTCKGFAVNQAYQ